MRMLLLAVLLSGCGASQLRRPCEFTVKVRVMEDEEADKECRRLGARRHDNGDFIKDTTTLRGCAPYDDTLITNGEEWVGGHELRHHVERNCGRKD